MSYSSMPPENSSRKNHPSFPILQVVQKYLKTIQRGENHWCHCPFHKDKTPSLSVSPSKNIYKCFSCNQGGDAIAFVRRMENCSYPQAIEKIVEILGLEKNSYLTPNQSYQSSLYEINRIASISYHRYLFNEGNQRILDYLTKERKISPESIDKYLIGYAPEESILSTIIDVENRKRKNKFTEVQIRKSNLFNTSSSKEGVRDSFFRNRIIFPILDKNKQVIGFSGRAMAPDDPIKYLNIRTGPLFSKSSALFNIQNLEKDSPIYLFEGFIDLIKCSQLGITNGIASMGGLLNKELFQTVRNYSKTIYLCLDRDEAGINFTINQAKELISEGFEVKVINLMDLDCKDVDEAIDRDREKTLNRLRNPINFFHWYYLINNSPTKLSEVNDLINTSLSFFFDTKNNRNYIKKNLDIDFYEESIEIIYGFLKKHKSYDPSRHDGGISKAVNRLKDLIFKNVIDRNEDYWNEREEINGGNPSTIRLNNLIYKYSNLLDLIVIPERLEEKKEILKVTKDLMLLEKLNFFGLIEPIQELDPLKTFLELIFQSLETGKISLDDMARMKRIRVTKMEKIDTLEKEKKIINIESDSLWMERVFEWKFFIWTYINFWRDLMESMLFLKRDILGSEVDMQKIDKELSEYFEKNNSGINELTSFLEKKYSTSD